MPYYSSVDKKREQEEFERINAADIDDLFDAYDAAIKEEQELKGQKKSIEDKKRATRVKEIVGENDKTCGSLLIEAFKFSDRFKKSYPDGAVPYVPDAVVDGFNQVNDKQCHVTVVRTPSAAIFSPGNKPPINSDILSIGNDGIQCSQFCDKPTESVFVDVDMYFHRHYVTESNFKQLCSTAEMSGRFVKQLNYGVAQSKQNLERDRLRIVGNCKNLKKYITENTDKKPDKESDEKSTEDVKDTTDTDNFDNT